MLTGTTVRRVDECLEAVVDYGTAAGARSVHEVDGARGKTGTTSDNKDAWFIGYTPELATTVYVNGVRTAVKGTKRIVRYSSMHGVTGGQVCAPIWGKFMRDAVAIAKRSRSGDPFAGITVGVDYPGAETRVAPAPSDPSASAGAPPAAEPTKPRAPDSAGMAEPSGAMGDGGPLEPGTIAAEPPPAARSSPSGTLPGAARPIAPTGAPPTAGSTDVNAVRAAPAPEPVLNVLVCADSGGIANDYCPEALRRKLPAGKVPKRKCRDHGPRPDER